MPSSLDFMKSFWVQAIILLTALGGVPGILALYDRYNAPPSVATAPAHLPAPTTTGSIAKRPQPKPVRETVQEKYLFDHFDDWWRKHVLRKPVRQVDPNYVD
ncbi:hypothetical protein [Hyphomicrobium sulfonivorans]|uniref:hypothetical protein n=1 Tax=Hyphomicrobium sulfonivorans TaxID=121290 RepID=UPI000A75D03C|nr:hypothetical protein [Hyphomicrobium sulfonivorans]